MTTPTKPENPTCVCGCGKPPRHDSTWLSVDARMFASEDCDRRWTHGLMVCSCGREFPKFLGGRIVEELICPICYESHPAIVGKRMAKVKAWEHEDSMAKVRRG